MEIPEVVVGGVYVGVPLANLLSAVVMGWWVYARRWRHPGSKWFVVVLTVASLWMVALLGHLLATGYAVQAAFQHLQMLLAMWTISAFVVFVSTYTRRGFHRRLHVRAGLVVGVAGSAALVATSPVHDLVYAGFTPRSSPVPYLASTPGPGYVVVLAVVVTLVGYSAYVLSTHLLSTGQQSAVQLVVILGGIVSVAGMEVVGRLSVVPADGLNHAAYGMFPFAALLTVGLFHLRLFAVGPVARSVVVERVSDPILVLDEAGRVVDHNQAAEAVWPALPTRTGDPLDAVAGDLADAVGVPPAVDASSVADAPAASGASTGGTPTGGASTSDPPRAIGPIVVPVDGDPRHFLVTVTPVERRYSDEVGWYAVLLRDVTELERSRRYLERQNEHLARVGSTITHDLRNPIQVAVGYAKFLEETIDDLAPSAAAAEPARDHRDRIEDALTRMDEIVEDVLTLAREGEVVESTESVSVAAAARTAWQTVETGEATLRVDGDRVVEADPGRLRTVFENLFRNSVEHADLGVTVTVAATDDGFAVADDGPGIPPEHADEIFEYGYTTDRDGTGFGLAIVRTMVESHGWTVDVDEDADGARFVVTCDAADAAGADWPGTGRATSPADE